MMAARAAVYVLLELIAITSVTASAVGRAAEPNTQVPVGSTHYVADGFPDRIVATPAQDAANGLAVAWRTDASVNQPWLELAVAGDSPDVGTPRRIRASTTTLANQNGSSHLAHCQRAAVRRVRTAAR
ncbi:hypothetical protein ADT26_05725 [Xanthomonas oryzae]|nr:hypothetical protein AXO1947_08415 [Xanthomonas oryzae pv. oryzae]KOR46559.1 hypothetical protein ADT26_05725 [Xanthomonas oryzae]